MSSMRTPKRTPSNADAAPSLRRRRRRSNQALQPNRRTKSYFLLWQRLIKKARAGSTNRCNNKYSQSFSLKLYILRSISGIMMPAPLCPARQPASPPPPPSSPPSPVYGQHGKAAHAQPILPSWQLLLLCNDGLLLKGFPFYIAAAETYKTWFLTRDFPVLPPTVNFARRRRRALLSNVYSTITMD